MKIGEMLVKAGVLEEAHLRRALRKQKRVHAPLGRVLVEEGWLDESVLVRALSAQLQLPVVDADALDIPAPLLEQGDGPFFRRAGVVPFKVAQRVLHVATANPATQRLTDELRVRFKMDVRFYLAGPVALGRALDRLLPTP